MSCSLSVTIGCGVVLLFVCVMQSCAVTSSTASNSDTVSSCGNCLGTKFESMVDSATVLHNPSDLYFLATPPACNDCEAQYQLSFQWANFQRSETDTSEPPLSDLTHAFGPMYELAYFPHPAPQRGGGTNYVWYLNFSVGNKTSSLPSTRYSFGCSIDRTRPHDPADSIAISCKIYYTTFKQ